MFKSEDFNITFRVLKDYNQYDVVFWDSDFLELDTIIESYISRGQLNEALWYLKYDVSYGTLGATSLSNKKNLKRLIFKKCNDISLALNALAENNPSNRMECNVLFRYLEGLMVHYTYAPPKAEIVPDSWITVYDQEYRGPLSRRSTEVQGVTKFCRITSNVEEYPELIGKHRYELHSFIGVFFALGFVKIKKVTKFKDDLAKLSSNDFSRSSTSNYIKTKIKPAKYQDNIKTFLDLLSHHIDTLYEVTYDQDFHPKMTISEPMTALFRQVVEMFDKYGDYEWPQLRDLCFNVVSSEDIYFRKELGYLTHHINKFVSQD